MEKNPWDYHPHLTHERLTYVSTLLVRARRETLDLYDEAGGDTPWGLGCRVYDRTCSLLKREAERIDWLSIFDSSLQFVFGIGSVPIRFYRGPSDTPKSNTLVCSFPELRQLHLAFPEERAPDLLWRFAIETDAIGEVSQVVFIGTDAGGNVRCSWTMPDIDLEVALPSNTYGASKPKGVELPAPKVDLPLKAPGKDAKTKDNDDK